ncbi:efflux RND transporter periplasmic adaptor subunit [Acidobacteria bacterium AH-259-O06]|nr:efflux RND transporter periplasmic adaptor subunit [Acidobacteria bacterium AH-259-O06]
MRNTVLPELLFALLTAAGCSSFLQLAESEGDVLILSGTVESRQIEVGSRVGGRISEVSVQEGDTVKAGQLLVRFETYDLLAKKEEVQAAVRQAEAELEKLRRGFRPEELRQARAAAAAAAAQLELLRRGPRQEEIDQAGAELDHAQSNWRNARARFNRVADLFERGVVSRQELDDALTNHERAEARKKAMQKQLDILLAGTRPEEIEAAEKRYEEAMARLGLLERGSRREDIEAAEARLERAQAQLKAMAIQLAETEVRAPADAFVEVLDIRPGDLIASGSPIAVLQEPDEIYVQVYIPETKLGWAQLGKRVQITVDSFPDEKFEGKIAFIARQGEFTPRNIQTRSEREHQVFAVRVSIENRDNILRPGMAADVRITLER